MIPSEPFLSPALPAAADTAALAARFAPGFVWGVATSAYQIEGAAYHAGKGESIWDRFCQEPGRIAGGASGEVACDHVHRLEEDLDLIASLGVNAYRFSVSWPRVMPAGRGGWNPAGLDFYRRLVDGLRQRGIAPWMTLNHWDLPQALQDEGGWAERDTVHHFVDYARGMHRAVGAQCAGITTHNEPWVMAVLGHETGVFAPGTRYRPTALQVAHHLLLSHGLALQALRADGCRADLGIVLSLTPTEPASDSVADREQARLDDGGSLRWYCDPLFHGHYPDDMLAHYAADAPTVLAGDMEHIAQPMDYLGVNNYTRHVARAGGGWDPAQAGLPVTEMGWEITPRSLTQLLLRLQHDYRPAKMIVTENGGAFADPVGPDGVVHDADRTRYLFDHIAAVADAADAGAAMAGYMVWSLMDNFEWASGYAKRFGIVHVDYATQRRTPKASAHWYRELMRRAAAAGRG